MRHIGESEKFVQMGGKPGGILGHMHFASLEPRGLGEKPRQLVPLGAQGDRPEMPGAMKILRQSPAEFGLLDQRARLLLLLANFGKEDKPEPIIAKISQETLAEMIGTTRSRVSFFMNKFRKLGFIAYNGGIEVHSSLLNAALHDEPQIRI